MSEHIQEIPLMLAHQANRYEVDVDIRDNWGTGLVADVNLTSDQAVNGWKIEIEYDGEIVRIWNASIVSQEGNRYTLENVSYNGSVPAGTPIGFGFVGAGTSTVITPIKVNGVLLRDDEPDNSHDHGDHHGHGDHGDHHGDGDHQDHGDQGSHEMPAPAPRYTDITAFGIHPGVSKHVHIEALEGGRTPITTEAQVAYNGLRAFIGLDPVELETIGEWAFANKLTNNPVPYGQDLKGVGLYYAMQGSKAGWIDDDAYDPQILADIQRTARLGELDEVMAMVEAHGHEGFADYLAREGLEEAFANTLKMEPHYGGWKHGRAHGTLEFDNAEGHRAPENSATAHDVNHLTVVNHAQTQPFYNDTFDWPQWPGRMVPAEVVINYFQSMVTLGEPKGEGITAEMVAAAKDPDDGMPGHDGGQDGDHGGDHDGGHDEGHDGGHDEGDGMGGTDGGGRPAFVLDGSEKLVFRASDYDAGGQGIGYNDAMGLQGGTDGGRMGSDVEIAPTGAVGWIADGEWLQYTIDVKEAGTYRLDLSMALGIPDAARKVTAEFFVNGVEVEEAVFDTPKTGSWRTFETTGGDVKLDAGLTVMRLTFNGGAQDLLDIGLTQVMPPQSAFNETRTPWLVDDVAGLTLAANLFDDGVQGVAYHDTTPGNQRNSDKYRPEVDVDVNNSDGSIGWIADGEWLEYTVNVEAAGIYDISLMLSGIAGGTAQVDVFRPGERTAYESSGVIQSPSTGSFQSFQARTATGLELEAGEQVIRVTFPTADSKQNFESLSVTRTAFVLDDSDTLVFSASSYDAGGQGIGYSDEAGLQGGTDGGRMGSDVEIAPTGAVGWIDDGEWLQYSIDVKDAGTYWLDLSMALGIPNAARQVRAEFFVDGVEVEEALFDTPKTGSWTTFETTGGTVELEAGLTVMRLTFEGGAQDLLDIEMTYQAWY
jgi:hypothetical protein